MEESAFGTRVALSWAEVGERSRRSGKMLRTMLSVDDRSPAAFGFVVLPKVGDRIGLWAKNNLTHATVVGMRRETGPDGSGLLLVSARSA
jgi:hypothetical protein